MIAVDLKASDILGWTGGRGEGAVPEEFSGVSTDSREPMAGALFVALHGERFDGHAFLSKAKASGAAAALVDSRTTLPDASLAFPRIEVDDTLQALGALARGHRRRFTPIVIGITGSVGKTTTKELVAAALSPLGPVLKTEGNLNNEIGVPQTILRLGPQHRAAVVEMGMNHLGEIARLAAIAEPRLGLVTNVRGVHLETLGTLEKVAEAKGELYKGLPDDGIAIADVDDPRALAQAKASGRRVFTFGRSAADVQLLAVTRQDLRGVAFRVRAEGQEREAQVAFLGEHNALNGTAALATALAAGVKLDAALAALAAARPAPHRLAVVDLPNGGALLDDCYNANPSSMAAALATLREVGAGRRLGAVLGDMLELGPEELELHRQLGNQAKGLDWLYAFGTRARLISIGAQEAGVPEVGHGTELEAASAWIRGQLRPGDMVLLKGSRGMKMERFATALGAPPIEGGH
jgi:UDP-N-acetylmuramoyl-tripeptide--D-alanyl-D-alanine ligase